MKSASFFLLAILCALASVDGLNTPSASDSPSAMRLFKRDLSPNPAAESHSGCRMKKGLQKRDGGKGGCATHTDTGIQIGECWSNTRVMGQKAAFFSPVSPGEKSYRNEGGPYGEQRLRANDVRSLKLIALQSLFGHDRQLHCYVLLPR